MAVDRKEVSTVYILQHYVGTYFSSSDFWCLKEIQTFLKYHQAYFFFRKLQLKKPIY